MADAEEHAGQATPKVNMKSIRYRGYTILFDQDAYEIRDKRNTVATGFGFYDGQSRAKELIDADFVTPMLEYIRTL